MRSVRSTRVPGKPKSWVVAVETRELVAVWADLESRAWLTTVLVIWSPGYVGGPLAATQPVEQFFSKLNFEVLTASCFAPHLK